MEDEITNSQAPVESAPEVMDTVETGVEESKVDEHEAENETQSTESDNSASTEQTEQKDEDYTVFLRKKGIDPTDPEALTKVAKMAANSEKMATKKAQRASELEKQFGQPSQYAESQALAEVQALKRKDAARDYVAQNDLSPEVQSEMVRIISEAKISNPLRYEQIAQGLLGLEDIHAQAEFNLNHRVDTEAIKAEGRAEGRTEALKSLAAKQRAGFPKGNATNGNEYQIISKDNAEKWYQGLTADERAKPETQRKLDSLLNS